MPDATVMVIEHAERFGLAQLHQLRGRVGRGDARLDLPAALQGRRSARSRKARLEMMRETEDGFRIAEEDLRLRGEGEVLGTRQSGLAGLPPRPHSRSHGELLEAARDDARLIARRATRNSQGERGQALRLLLYLFERDEAVRLLARDSTALRVARRRAERGVDRRRALRPLTRWRESAVSPQRAEVHQASTVGRSHRRHSPRQRRRRRVAALGLDDAHRHQQLEAPSSGVRSTSLTRARSMMTRKPVVGFGVQGMKTAHVLAGRQRLGDLALAAGSAMKQIDHRPLRGYSISPTLRKMWPSCLNTVSKICFTPCRCCAPTACGRAASRRS